VIAIIDFLFSLMLFVLISFNLNYFDLKQNYDQKLDNLKLLNNKFQYFENISCEESKNLNFQILRYKKFLKVNDTLILNELCFKKE